MDTPTFHRQIVKDVILHYAALRPSHGDIRLDHIFDEVHDRYALVQVGWDRGRRVRGLLLYVTLDGDRICIEYDGMECGITDDLIQRGIAEEQIDLAYLAEMVV
jgi:hypothetical protein